MPILHLQNFDISAIPQDTVFILDTNILYYVHSGYYIQSNNKVTGYSNLIQQLLNNGYNVTVSALSIQELLFGIENKEYMIYCNGAGLSSSNYTKKDFRKNVNQRVAIKSKFKAILSELSIYNIENGTVLSCVLEHFVDTFELHKMDPIDFILASNYDSEKAFFITDDRDFQSLTSINILTF